MVSVHRPSVISHIAMPTPPPGPSLVAQMAKNLPATWESWVRSLVQGDSLEEGMATHSRILASDPG